MLIFGIDIKRKTSHEENNPFHSYYTNRPGNGTTRQGGKELKNGVTLKHFY